MALQGTAIKLSDGTNEYLIASTAYGECSTAATTAAKTVNITGDGTDTVPFTLVKGVSIRVKFTNTNSAANPTLNVNNSDNIPIKRYGTTAPDITNLLSWNAGAVISFTYDGAYWQMENWVNGSVVQETSSANTNYPILLKGTTAADVFNGRVYATSTTNNLVTINPNTGNLNVQKINGVIPSFSDSKVTQTKSTANSNYPLILKNSANDTTETTGVNATPTDKITANPSTGNLNVVKINGVNVGSTPSFGDHIYTGASPISVNSSTNVISHVNSGATAGIYGSTTSVAKVQVDATGHIISVENVAITGFAPTSHTHGNITSDGKITSDTAIASGFKLVATDTTGKVIRTSLSFDGGTETQFLTKKGTWKVPAGTAYTGAGDIEVVNHTIQHVNTIDSAPTTALYPISFDDEGHITGSGAAVIITDTKNTTGSTASASKLYLVGATTQATSTITYTNTSAFVSSNNHLYSGGKEVLVGGSNASSAVTIVAQTTNVYSITSVGSVTPGSPNTPTQINTAKFSGGSYLHSGFSGGNLSHSGFSGGSFISGTFNRGALPALTMTMDTSDTACLNIVFATGSLPSHAADSFTPASYGTDNFTPASYGTDSFVPAAFQNGFYTPGSANVPTSVTLPTRGAAQAVWSGYASATAAAQTFTGAKS